MNFELKKTYADWAIKQDRVLSVLSFFEPFFLILSAVFGSFYLVFGEEISLGLFLIFIPLALLSRNVNLFRKERLRKIPLSENSDNLADFLDFDLAKIFITRKPQGPNSLAYYIFKDCKDFNFILYRCLLPVKEVMEGLKEEENSNDLLPLIKAAFEKKESQLMDPGDILMVLPDYSQFFKRIMIEAEINQKDLKSLVFWLKALKKERKKPIEKRGSLGKKWVTGYSLTLDSHSRDITSSIADYAEFVSHKKEANLLERALVKGEKSNALIVGNPGSGRKSVVYNLAQRSLFNRSLPGINYRRVVELDMEALLAKIQDVEEVEFTLDRIFKEALLAGDIIILIDNIHEYVGEAKKLGVVDITGIISSYLKIPQFKIIGITDYTGLHEKIEKNPSFLNLFEKIEVSEVSPEETMEILQTIVPSIEAKYKVFVSYPALKSVIDLSERYLPSLSFPEKGIELLEDVSIFVLNSKEETVLPKHVAKVITEKTEIPVGEIDVKEKEILLNLEELIHQRIIGQEEAVKEISTALRRARSEITTKKGPMGCFLFLGPTGVGKTETAKALADIYFGSEKKIIRLDMSEFQSTGDIARLIGSSDETGLLTSPVKESPFSLLLLDEFEKAHPNILNLFLQVLDEGHITDGIGRKIDFKNTIIIATSNAGHQVILEAIEKGKEWQKAKEELLFYVLKTNIFRPELVNRFDGVVMFSPLRKEELLKISNLILSSLKGNLGEKGIEFLITENLKEKIVELGYDPRFGAREMRRVIQEKIENKLAEALLLGKIGKGEKIEIEPENFEIIKN